MAVYVIGGSPCSGKSTVAEALSRRFGLRYVKVDDSLDRYLRMAADAGKPCCARAVAMTPDEIWMRDPQVQCDEELAIYEEISEYVLADLQREAEGQDVITEGAAWLPVLAGRFGIPHERYISLTPDKAFQVRHYSQREWVPHVLEGCTDRAAAFANWMERDALFAKAVQQQCAAAGYVSVVNGGDVSVDELTARIASHFGLG